MLLIEFRKKNTWKIKITKNITPMINDIKLKNILGRYYFALKSLQNVKDSSSFNTFNQFNVASSQFLTH